MCCFSASLLLICADFVNTWCERLEHLVWSFVSWVRTFGTYPFVRTSGTLLASIPFPPPNYMYATFVKCKPTYSNFSLFVYLHIRLRTDLHICLLGDVRISIHKCSNTALFVYASTHVFVCLGTPMFVYLHFSLLVYVLLCVYLHICKYACICALVPYN